MNDSEVDVFGYGSLVWRPDFEHISRTSARLPGFARRFWQGSTDHRGTPERPGRVVTLVSEPDSDCWGVVYRVDRAVAERVLAKLDHRESGGYERRWLDVYRPQSDAWRPALVYWAGPTNPNYVGPLAVETIAERAAESHGPSGANTEYVFELESALAEMDRPDEHVSAVATAIRRILHGRSATC